MREGQRVRAVNFVLDEGLRIWPVDPAVNLWRVVDVRDQAVQREFMRGPMQDCQAAHPDARFGINDNETVPPGTEGTVELVDAANTWVRWDNGCRLNMGPSDDVEVIA